jgi:hypothetical protein
VEPHERAQCGRERGEASHRLDFPFGDLAANLFDTPTFHTHFRRAIRR